MHHVESVWPWKGVGMKGPSIMMIERAAWGQQSGRTAGATVRPGWHEVGVATRLAKVGQGDPMVASGHGHVLGGDMDKVDGCLVHSFGQGGRCRVVVAAG